MVINVCSAQTTRDSKLMDCDKLFEMLRFDVSLNSCRLIAKSVFCALESGPTANEKCSKQRRASRTMENILSNFSHTRAHRSNKSFRSMPMITIARQRTTKAEKNLFVSLFPAHSLYNNREEKFDKLTSSLSSVADVSSLD